MITMITVHATDDHGIGWANIQMDQVDDYVSITTTNSSGLRFPISDARTIKEALNRMFPES